MKKEPIKLSAEEQRYLQEVLKKANKKPTGLYFFIAIVGLFMATIGAQGFWSFYKSLRSKTTAQVIDNYSYKSGKYSYYDIIAIKTGTTDTLHFSERSPSAAIGQTIEIWDVADDIWIKPFFLREKSDRPPSQELFTGFLRHDSGLGTFFLLMGSFITALMLLSIQHNPKE